MIEFENIVNIPIFLIHDLGPMFTGIDYSLFNIENVCTSVCSPNMNSIAERFVRSIRNEALNNFIIINKSQISKIIKEYIDYYNFQRPHQMCGRKPQIRLDMDVEQAEVMRIPKGIPPNISLCSHNLKGSVSSKSVLGGLHHHYFLRKTA